MEIAALTLSIVAVVFSLFSVWIAANKE